MTKADLSKAGSGETLVEDARGRLRAEIRTGGLVPGERLHLSQIAKRYGVSLGVIREAVTRLASDCLLESEPQKGFWVRALSVTDLHELTWMRIQLESLAVAESIAHGDISWESDLVAAHHTLAKTPIYDRTDAMTMAWMNAHRDFHTALAAGCTNRWLLRFRLQLWDASELYRSWVANLERAPRRLVDREHKRILDAALARDVDRAVTLVTRDLEMTAEALVKAVTTTDPNRGTDRG
jgi:DNA-binding GntR family transcriptional regulator